MFRRGSGSSWRFGFAILRNTCRFARGSARFRGFDSGGFGVVGRELVRGGLFVFVLFALTPTPLPRGEGLFRGGSDSSRRFGFAILRKTCGFARGGAGFCGFDGGGFGVVGRGRRCVGGCFDVGAGIGNVTPSPTLPRCGR